MEFPVKVGTYKGRKFVVLNESRDDVGPMATGGINYTVRYEDGTTDFLNNWMDGLTIRPATATVNV